MYQEYFKPCVIQAGDGAPAYYLQKDDMSKKEDGFDAVTTGADGDVMIEVKKLYGKFLKSGNQFKVSISNKKEDDTWFCFTDFGNGEQEDVYELEQAKVPTSANTADKKVPYYRLAYRKGYYRNDSKEILHSVRVQGNDITGAGRYCWHSWYSKSVPRNAYCPTQEYVEKFSWSDGEPFNWDNAAKKTYSTNSLFRSNNI